MTKAVASILCTETEWSSLRDRDGRGASNHPISIRAPLYCVSNRASNSNNNVSIPGEDSRYLPIPTLTLHLASHPADEQQGT